MYLTRLERENGRYGPKKKKFVEQQPALTQRIYVYIRGGDNDAIFCLKRYILFGRPPPSLTLSHCSITLVVCIQTRAASSL